MENKPFDVEKEWVGMPEFSMEDLSPFRKIVVAFRDQKDVEAFARLLQQKITPKQKSLWFPEMPIRHFKDKRYVDSESSPEEEDLTPYLHGGFFTNEP